MQLSINLNPQPPSLQGLGENSKPLSRVGERFSTSREKLDQLAGEPSLSGSINGFKLVRPA